MSPSANRSALIEHLVDRLSDALPGFAANLSARRMFGSTGLFAEGLMFAIVEDETLFLKVDEESRERFEAAGLEPFRYRREGVEVALGYWTAPAEILEDDAILAHWIGEALGAARRSNAGKRRARPSPKGR